MVQIKFRGSAVAALALLVAAGSLAGHAQTAPAAQAAPANQSSNGQTRLQPQLQERYPRYVIQRSDVLELTFPFTTELNQTVTVQPDGYVNLQNEGALHVQGMTVPEMVAAVREAYIHVLHNPVINIDVKDFQKPFYTVSGQVGKPGQYELRSDITVAEGLAVAGGMTPMAKTQVFLFHRTSTQWFAVRQINMKEILKGKNTNEDAVLQPGDMIYVPEKFISNFRKYVPYGVNAGTYLNESSF